MAPGAGIEPALSRVTGERLSTWLPWDWVRIQSRAWDSNPDRRCQRPACCHCTSPQDFTVGARGVEPPVVRVRTGCLIRLATHPCGPGWSRTTTAGVKARHAATTPRVLVAEDAGIEPERRGVSRLAVECGDHPRFVFQVDRAPTGGAVRVTRATREALASGQAWLVL